MLQGCNKTEVAHNRLISRVDLKRAYLFLLINYKLINYEGIILVCVTVWGLHDTEMDNLLDIAYYNHTLLWAQPRGQNRKEVRPPHD